MKENDIATKEKIITGTLEIIQKEKDYSKITVRRIIQDTGVSLSAVNYHFGSKEKLINEVIGRRVKQYMSSQPDPNVKYGNEPIKALKEAVKLPADYLADNPNISRISIIMDMSSPLENDMAVQTMLYWKPFIKAVFINKADKEIELILWEITSTIQAAFLRNNIFKTFTGIDYFNKTERDSFIEELIDTLIVRNSE